MRCSCEADSSGTGAEQRSTATWPRAAHCSPAHGRVRTVAALFKSRGAALPQSGGNQQVLSLVVLREWLRSRCGVPRLVSVRGHGYGHCQPVIL